jgi:hypothetical protein
MPLLKNTGNKILIPNRNLGNGLIVRNESQSKTINIANNSAIDIDKSTPFTIAIWLIPLSVDVVNRPVLAKRTYGDITHGGWYLSINSTAPSFTITGYDATNGVKAENVNCAASFIKNKRVHLVLTKDGSYGASGDYKFYIDGVLKTTVWNSGGLGFSGPLLATSVTSTTSIVRAGGYSGADLSDNVLLDFKMWNIQLAQADVTNLFKSRGSLAGLSSGLVADIRFNEKHGKAAADLSPTGLTTTLIGYSDAETANAGQPQSGNTVWIDAYSLAPITI